MLKRSLLVTLVAVAVLSVAAGAANEQLFYTGDFVSVGGTTQLCARAVDESSPLGVPGVGVWFQAWTMAGIPRLNGPLDTVFTNSVGNVCLLKSLNAGLYTVQAFGATGDFDGVASFPVVVGSLTRRAGASGTATAGVGSVRSISGPREVALGLLVFVPCGAVTGNVVPGGARYRALQASPGPLVQFLLLDPDNPAGPTSVVFARNTLIGFTIGTAPPATSTFFQGFCDVQIGDTSSRAFTTASMSIQNGRIRPSVGMLSNFVITGDGNFEVLVTAPTGRVLYHVEGRFVGQTGFLAGL